MGGSDAGLEGAGYCREGHAGPRCALCTNSSQYYSEGTCIDCPDAQNRAMISLLTALAVLVFVVSSRAAFSRCAPISYHLNIRRLRRIMAWLSAIAFVPKFKLVIGFVQTVKLLPDVYALELPRFYDDWVGFLSAFQIDWSNMIYPGSCLNGGYLSVLLLRALGPLALMGLLLVIGVAYGVAPQVLGLREGRPPWQQSLVENLPAQLVISFCLIPSTSNSIFAVWTCETFQLDSTVNPPTTVQFLTEDVTLKCVQSDAQYSRLLHLAYVFMAMWPVGVPLLFLLVLLHARSSIQSGNSSNLVRATKFLHREYVKEFHWWEVLFLLQRLVIVGFARLISHGPHRLLFGTLIALSYFGALLVVKPYKRSDVGWIACSCQIVIVLLLYMSTYAFQLHSLHEAEDVVQQSDLSWSITGFRDIDHLSAVVIVILLGFLAGLLILTLYQLFASYDAAILMLVSNRQPPELVMDAGKQYHLFLSHTWSSGQDQVATIKRRLQLLLTGCRIFLE
ncbi:hypothetical protein AB1Y20_016745 [Prymnesium parvum]|uniref:Receptor for retinol uptake STRA6 n=1 Tax=Prymnesium parvum TaxID=97485 RepID=A0AB34I8Q8_PRYPA